MDTPEETWIELKLTSEMQEGPMHQWKWTQSEDSVPEFLQGIPLPLWRNTFEATKKVVLSNLQAVETIKTLKGAADDRLAKILKFALPSMLLILLLGFILLGTRSINKSMGWALIIVIGVYGAIVAWDEKRALKARSEAVAECKRAVSHEAQDLCVAQQQNFKHVYIHVSLVTALEQGYGILDDDWSYRPVGLRFALLGSDKPLTIELQRLKQLHNDGALTEEEYGWAKRRLIGCSQVSSIPPSLSNRMTSSPATNAKLLDLTSSSSEDDDVPVHLPLTSTAATDAAIHNHFYDCDGENNNLTDIV